MRTILFDGDILTYKVGFVTEDKHVTLAYLLLDNMIKDVCKILDTESYKIYLTSSTPRPNFRIAVAKTLPYKGNRKDNVKPIHYQALRDHMVNGHKAELIDAMEADDMLGIVQGEDTVIASIDKDLLMIPGHHYNLTHKEKSEVSDPGELKLERRKGKSAKITGGGFKWFCAQMLLGDTVDNIKGVKWFGPVATFKALEGKKTELECWRTVERIYRQEGEQKRIGESANLLWILREKGQHFKHFMRTLRKKQHDKN